MFFCVIQCSPLVFLHKEEYFKVQGLEGIRCFPWLIYFLILRKLMMKTSFLDNYTVQNDRSIFEAIPERTGYYVLYITDQFFHLTIF